MSTEADYRWVDDWHFAYRRDGLLNHGDGIEWGQIVWFGARPCFVEEVNDEEVVFAVPYGPVMDVTGGKRGLLS